MRRLSGEKRAGFTLLEILVALAILSILALTALKNNSSMISNEEYLQDKTMAHWVGMNKAAELRLAGQWVVGDGDKGESVLAARLWSWQVTGQSTPDPDLQLIRIKVWRDKDRKVTPLSIMEIYLRRPTSS